VNAKVTWLQKDSSPGRRGLSISGEPSRALVQAAVRFDEIGQALIRRFCFSGVPECARPFAAGLGICDLQIGCAENHDTEWLRLHLWCVELKAKGRPDVCHGADR